MVTDSELENIVGNADLNPKQPDRPNGQPGDPIVSRPECMKIASILCSEKQPAGQCFAVTALTSGKVLAVWDRHAHAADDLAALLAADVLNIHERALLSYGVGKS